MILASIVLTALLTQPVPETDLVAAVLIAEAGGEGRDGMRAVYEVICTRSQQRGLSLADVVTQRKQFSCLNKTAPAALVSRSRKHPRWAIAVEIASNLVSSDLTHGSDHFCRVDCNPSWARNIKPVAVAGNHKFYRLAKQPRTVVTP